MMNVHVNGKSTTVVADTTVAALVENLQLDGKRFAIERNGEIVPKSMMGSVVMQEGDTFEIVMAVGGG
jgi:thiamine biosynthesis protein ThiS